MNYQRIKNYCKFTSVFLFFLFSCVSNELKLDQSLVKGKLVNGLRYYIYKNQTPKNAVNMGIVFNVGSLNEEDNERGIAHYLEHMAFNGTKDYPGNSIVDVLKKFGMQFGADINAATSFDFTYYRLDLSDGNNKDEIDESINILRNWASQISFMKEEIDLERNIIIEEKKLGETYPGRIYEKMYKFLTSGSLYEFRSPIGLEEQILSFQPEDFKKFYRKWYRPELASVIVVGDIDPIEIEEKIKKQFVSWKNPTDKIKEVKVSLDVELKDKFLLLEDLEVGEPSLMFFKKEIINFVKTKDDLLNAIKKSLLAALFENRFYELKTAGVKQFKNVSNKDFFSFKSDNNTIVAKSISLNFNPDHLNEGIQDFFYELERIRKFGFTQGEFEKVRSQFYKSLELRKKNINKTNSWAIFQDLIEIAINGSNKFDMNEYCDLSFQYLEKIDLKTINNLVGREFDVKNCAIFYSYHGRAHPVLTLEDIDNLQKIALKRELKPYENSSIEGEFFKKSLDDKDIIRENEFENEISSFVLENGVEVYFKYNDQKKGVIDFSATSWGGLLNEDLKLIPVLSFAPGVVSGSGYGDYSALQIEKYLSDKAVSLRVEVGAQESYISGSSDKKDLETLFQLIYFTFKEPKIDDVSLQNAINNIKALIKSNENSSDYHFHKAISKFLNNNDPRFEDTKDSDLQYFTKENILSFYKKRFTYANNFKFVFAGDSDIQTIKAYSKKYLGNLNFKEINEYKDLDYSYSKDFNKIVVRKGKNSTSFAYVIYPFKFNYLEETSLNLNALADLLTDGLIKNIREKMSSVYSIQAFFDSNLRKNVDSDGILSIFFTTEPKELDNVLNSINRYMTERQKIDFNDKDFSYVKKNYIKNTKINSEKNGYWISNILASLSWYGVFKNNFGVKFIETNLNKDLINQFFKKINLDEKAEILLIPE
ncbi:M16 family metallopeptidase [Borreliella burgdorferi]|uniref:M16 family metallopeptidase n=7 Tax=Borreliella burgdorferi TaxID=139 RepID=UPI00017F32B3|nr:insulinase family protein [Borreliella burgdorferi]EEF82691.1 putative zinc protease [Borreliella burgdorferi WI91-23]MCD2308695.1 insulinase family protein [Borreliella burgdorferi]MCD2318160.1 insulinase family protein [Borreliella burgdorferi]MCD2376468.1 insulinase family protein [Borreliella burgdorferi]MCD2380871.1 insulinase family protein [Borreliella burgdorferi]